MTKSYSGYFNYYVGKYLKTYYFTHFSEAMYYMYQRVLRLRATVYVGALVVECEDLGNLPKGYEQRTLVDQDTLIPTEESQKTLCQCMS